MKRLSDALSDDTNQFGPGTDLTISLLAVLMVMTLITAYLYRTEIEKNATLTDVIARTPKHKPHGGNFRLASDSFSAADFRAYPVTELVDRKSSANRVRSIIDEHRRLDTEYPYIFIIGHSSALDDPRAEDRSTTARRQRNWIYAARRATLIAGLMEEGLGDDVARIVVVTAGELDLKVPDRPLSQENAWVEVVFGKEWSIPERNGG